MRKYTNLLAGTVTLIVSIVIYVASNGIKRMVVTSIGPDFMPKIVAVMMGILSIVLIIQELQKLKRNKQQVENSSENKCLKSFNIIKFAKANLDIVTLVLIILYAVAMPILGFLISTVVYLFIQMLIMSQNRKINYLAISIISVVFSTVIYFVFTKVLFVMLPSGILG